MASIAKEKTGWGVQIAVQDVRESRTFSTEEEANAWAAQRETEILTEKATGIQRGRTVDNAFRRYEKDVSVHKRGHEKEAIRLAAVGRMLVDGVPLADWKLADVTPEVLGKWRDMRLTGTAAMGFKDTVLGSSVNRDLILLSHVFSSAVKEWKWIAKSPTTEFRRPANPPPRNRLYTDDEVERLCAALGIAVDQVEPVESTTQRVSIAFLFAIETAMRACEICALRPEYISRRVATLMETKNGTKRNIPLSTRAAALLGLLPSASQRWDRILHHGSVPRRSFPQGAHPRHDHGRDVPRHAASRYHPAGQETEGARPSGW